MSAPLRIGVLPRDLDGLFLPEGGGFEVVYLVLGGSAEESWARAVAPPHRVSTYDLLAGDLGPYPATSALLRGSTIHEAVRRDQLGALLLSASTTRPTHAWARRHGVRLLATDYLAQRRLEDKIAFHALCTRLRLPKPRGAALTLRPGLRMPAPAALVIQDPRSMGGEGTHFARDREEALALLDRGVLHAGRRYLVRERIDGRPFGASIVVAPGRVALSAVRLQAYYPGDANQPAAFAGVQWIPTKDLGPVLCARLDDALLRLGDHLHARGFRGVANVDFMVDARDRPFLIECNPRLSAATPQLLRFPELLGEPAGPLLLEALASHHRSPRAVRRSGLPDSAYEGATLDLVQTSGPVARALATGRYSFPREGDPAFLGPDVASFSQPDEIALVSFAREGQTATADSPLGSLLSNRPLHDSSGAPLPEALRLVRCFAGP